MEPIKIGDVELQGTEASEPVVFGGERMQVRHKFTGGLTTIQDFGAFPVEAIIVGGIMYGEFAEVRSDTLRQLQINLSEVRLTWSRQKYLGVVHSYKATVKHKNRIEYELEFWPTLDESNPKGKADTTDTQQAIGSALNDSQKLWEYLFGRIPKAVNFPPNVAPDWERMMQNLGTFRRTNLPSTPMPGPVVLRFGSAISDLIRDLAPVRLSGGTTSSYQASLAINSLLILRNAIVDPPKQYLRLPVSNPNLVTLASQYYGDPSMWTVIAKANDLGNETMPVGDFVLKIPLNVPGAKKQT